MKGPDWNKPWFSRDGELGKLVAPIRKLFKSKSSKRSPKKRTSRRFGCKGT